MTFNRYLRRIENVVFKYNSDWDMAAKKDDSWRTHLHFINNYPIHKLIPHPMWMVYKKVICSLGPKCVLCMCGRWILLTYLLCKLEVI